MNYNLLCILGATATGKTALAVALASLYDGEIISADSRQVYKGMSIGTGKDLKEYGNIPYHLIDIHPAGYKYNLFDFTQDFHSVFSAIRKRHKTPIICGGSGLYIEAVLNDYQLIAAPPNKKLRDSLEQKSQEELIDMLKSYGTLHNRSDTSTKKRTIRAIEIAMHTKEFGDEKIKKHDLQPLVVGIDFSVAERRTRITQRLHTRLNEGMIEEVENLLKSGISADDLIYYGLEYKYITYFLTAKLSYNEMVAQLNTAIHRFAKRQMTWFRRMERKGTQIQWLDGNTSLQAKVNRITELWNC